MLLTGDVYTALEAKEMRLVNKIVDSDLIDKEVLEFALKLVKTVSSESIALTKTLLNNIKGHSLDEQLEIAAAANAQARASNDCKRGISAFLNKEKLTW